MKRVACCLEVALPGAGRRQRGGGSAAAQPAAPATISAFQPPQPLSTYHIATTPSVLTLCDPCERGALHEALPPCHPTTASAMAATKEQLRLFQTLDGKRSAAQAATAAAATATKQREVALAAGSSPRFPFHAVSSRYDQATTVLLLHIVAHSYATSGSAALPGFDRSSSNCAANSNAAEGQLAAAFADRLVPGWWHLTRGLLWRWHLRRLMETPCWGVPGLSGYYRARAAWLREQIQLAIDGDGCR